MTIRNLDDKVSLELISGTKFYELIPGASPDDHFEATGVSHKDGKFLVVFHDTPHFARIAGSIEPGHELNRLYRNLAKNNGYVDVTYDGRGRRFLALTPGKKQRDGSVKPRINQFDTELAYVEGRFIDYDQQGHDRILRGLAAIWQGAELSILAICQGNQCKGGRSGQTPGGGRIQVFRPETGYWARVDTISLPKDLPFSDFVSLEVRGNRLAILSQTSAAVWIGALQDSGWGFVDDGAIYYLPESKEGNNIFCTVEGISWVDDQTLAVVSDSHRGRRMHQRCARREQSIHLFKIPPGS